MSYTPGLVSISFRKESIETIIEASKSVGLKSIEWGGDIHVPVGKLNIAQKCRELTLANDLEISAYGSYLKFDYLFDSSKPDTSQETLDTAKALGAPAIRIWAGIGDSEAVSSDERKTVTQAIREFANRASDAGIRVALEYHSGTLTNNADSAVQLMEDLDHPNVDLYWQPTTGSTFEYSLASLKKVLPHVSNIHCFHWGLNGFQDRKPISQGSEDWSAYLKILKSDSKNRHISLEFMHDDSLDSLATEAKSLQSFISNSEKT